MPLHCCRGESSRPSEDPGCAWIRRKVEAQGERKNCVAHKISWLQQGEKKKKSPLAIHPQLRSQGRGEEGGFVFAVGWTRRKRFI